MRVSCNTVSSLIVAIKNEDVFHVTGYEEQKIPYGTKYTVFSKESKAVVTIYDKIINNTQNVVIQGGANSSELVKNLLHFLYTNEEKSLHLPIIGTDESGKGDYFGPLVVGGVLLTEKSYKRLQNNGILLQVKDSKKLTDERMVLLSASIKSFVKWKVLVLHPTKYNELYSKFKNINKLLAWAHATAISDLLQSAPSGVQIVIDKFAFSNFRIDWALKQKGITAPVEQVHHGEANIAVAMASILARSEFYKQIKMLSQTWRIDFPLGTGHNIATAKQRFVEKYNKDELKRVAKIHFNV